MFEELFATAPDAMIVVDPHGRIVRVNLQAEQMFGYREQELRSQPVEILIPERARQAHRLHRANYAANPRVRPMGSGQELVGLKRDGTQFPVEIALSPFNTEAGALFVASIRDISETQRARQSIVRERYDAAIAQIGYDLLGAANIDAATVPTLQVVAAALAVDALAVATRNPHSDKMQVRAAFEAPTAAINDLPWSLVLRNAQAHRAKPAASATHSSAIVNESVLAAVGFNTTMIYPLFGHSVVTGAMLILSREWRELDRDAEHFLESAANLLAAAMQRIHTEDQLSHAQRLEAIGQLTGGVAHDFNNLLTVVSGNLQILEDRLAGSAEDREIIASALRATSRGAELTRKLLAFARQQRLSPRACEPQKFLSDLGSMLQRTLGEAIKVEIECTHDVPPVFADPAHLDNALVNLALNSRDAMSEGGILRISAAAATIDSTGVSEGVRPGNYVAFAVRDTGSGMGPEVLARAFEPFFTTKEQSKGSGLGLSMVYGFVRQSGGHLTAESEVGGGTQIKLYLPVATAYTVEKSAPKPASHRGNETVLVVEDETDVRNVAETFLQSLGYKVLCVSNAEDALKSIAVNPKIDVVFSDIVLGPGKTGKELAVEIRRKHPRVRILLTSGYESSPNPEGADQPFKVLQKPYTREELAAALHFVLQTPLPKH
jgi:PAS domain S-box-containing protein